MADELRFVLALDCGTKTGWAALRDAKIESGVQLFDLRRGESAGMRWLRFDAWLWELYKWFPFTLIVYEQAHHRGGAATAVGVGFTTKILEFAALRKCETMPVHTATLKKFTTGGGKADKEEMKRAIARRWEKLFLDDNEADAYALLRYAMEELAIRRAE